MVRTPSRQQQAVNVFVMILMFEAAIILVLTSLIFVVLARCIPFMENDIVTYQVFDELIDIMGRA